MRPEALRIVRARATFAAAEVPIERPRQIDYARIDFAAIDRTTRRAERDSARALAELLAEAVWKLLEPERLQQLLTDDITGIAQVKIDTYDLGKLKVACKQALERGWKLGQRHARSEAMKFVREHDAAGAAGGSGGGGGRVAGLRLPDRAAARLAAPLYVHRPLLNGHELAAWAKAQGFETTVEPDRMHVTLAFSKTPVVHAAMPHDERPALRIEAGAFGRTVEALGDGGAVVLRFESAELEACWQRLKDAGCSWDYDGYRPHVTLTWNAPTLDLALVRPYDGPLIFGAEVFEPLQENWKETVTEFTRELFKDLRDDAAAYFEANGFRMAQNLADGARNVIQQELTRAVRVGEAQHDTAARILNRLVGRGFTDRAAIEATVDDPGVLESLSDLLEGVEADLTPSYLNTLVRTNVFEAMNEARFAEFTDPALGGYVQAFEYSAILDANTTEFCRYMDRRVYAAENEIWDEFRPPNHFNCRSILIPITKLSGWDGVESEPPEVVPAEGFARAVGCGHVHLLADDGTPVPHHETGSRLARLARHRAAAAEPNGALDQNGGK